MAHTTPTLADVMAKIEAWPNRRDARLNQDEAPLYCGLTKGHLAQLRFTGRGPRFFKPTARTVLYTVGDLDDWLSSKVCTSTHDTEAANARAQKIAGYHETKHREKVSA